LCFVSQKAAEEKAATPKSTPLKKKGKKGKNLKRIRIKETKS